MARSDPATDRQIEYAQTLLRDREVPQKLRDALERPQAQLVTENYTRGAISSLIELLQGYRRTVTVTVDETAKTAVRVGVYAKDGEIYVVKPNRQGTRLYAKRLVDAPSDRLHENGDVGRYELEFAPGVVGTLREQHRMPAVDVAALAVRYGRCIMCGRGLKAASSVERMIGPVCWQKVS